MQRTRLLDPDPTIAAPPEAGPRAEPSAARLTAAGVMVSVALHLLGYGAVRALREPAARPTPTFHTIDLDIAPVAPPAEELPAERERTAAAVEPGVPVVPPPVDLDRDGVGRLDAGVADAGLDAATMAADARVADARPPRDAGTDGPPRDAGVDGAAGDAGAEGLAADAGLVAIGDGDAGLGDGGAGVGDGGAAIASADLDGGGGAGDAGVGDGDGGPTVATTGDPDRTGGAGARASTGTAANLLAYAPAGHVVTLLARLDRLRGTPWVEPVEAMLAPLPDHDALIGRRAVKITDVFDTLVISTPDPSSADATTLVARTRLGPAELRALLDQPDARVAWTPTVGGALGRRAPGPRLIPGDVRVFLAWAPGWATLARPDDLGGLLAPATIGLDHAFADPARLPPWLAGMTTIEDESGVPDGPALMLTAAGMFPALLDLPLVDVDIPGPERATLTLTVDPAGFIVRGSLRYADAAAAATAADRIVRAQKALSDSTLARLALSTARAWNAVRGLTVRPTGARVAFSTSISAGDGQVLLARLTDLVEAHFERVRRVRRPRQPTGDAPTPPAPAGGP